MTEPYIPRTQKGVFANALVWILGILALVGICIGIVWAWRYFTAPMAGKIAARQQIQSGSFRIAAYNHFFDLCAAVQSDEARLAAQYTELETATGDDVARVRANIAGISSDRADALNQYNADAQKDYTIGQFKSSKLPFQLDPIYVKGAHTPCVA